MAFNDLFRLGSHAVVTKINMVTYGRTRRSIDEPIHKGKYLTTFAVKFKSINKFIYFVCWLAAIKT
jgi:hypothetical protein